jgi:hypothetical protein
MLAGITPASTETRAIRRRRSKPLGRRRYSVRSFMYISICLYFKKSRPEKRKCRGTDRKHAPCSEKNKRY